MSINKINATKLNVFKAGNENGCGVGFKTINNGDEAVKLHIRLVLREKNM